MTCIVAIVDEHGHAFVAGDSFVGNMPGSGPDETQTIRKEPKVWIQDGMVCGGNGSVRMLQIAHYLHEPPLYASGQNKVRYLVKDFIPSLQDCLASNEHSVEDLGGSLLLAIEGELFTIARDFGVCSTEDHYETVGKAGQIATGSLHTTAHLRLPTCQRLFLALQAAERHTCVVSAPYYYISSDMTEPQELLPEAWK